MQTDSTSSAPSTGNILASGDGKGNTALTLWWAMWVICAVACCATLAYVASDLAGKSSVQVGGWAPWMPTANIVNKEAQQKAAIFNAASMIVPVLCLVYGVFYHLGIAGSRIQVDGNGVSGKGVGKGWIWGDPRLFGFRLAYNQITSVDVAGSTIIIHASGAQYKCFVQNPADIQRVIAEQQQKVTNRATA